MKLVNKVLKEYRSKFGTDVQRGPSGTEGYPIGKELEQFISEVIEEVRQNERKEIIEIAYKLSGGSNDYGHVMVDVDKLEIALSKNL